MTPFSITNGRLKAESNARNPTESSHTTYTLERIASTVPDPSKNSSARPESATPLDGKSAPTQVGSSRNTQKSRP